jgi:Ca2+-transporting ATPase
MTDTPVSPHSLSPADCAAHLQSDANAGLRSDDAARRLESDGPNSLDEAPPTPLWRRILGQFRDVMVLLLLAATAVSGILWWIEGASSLPYEALAILSIVLLNAILGLVQQAKADSAVAALRKMTAARATVLRDGASIEVPASDLVVGDLLRLEEGDAVPADARLSKIVGLQAAEASLTGESVPVSKELEALAAEAPLADRRNMVHSGTTIVRGRGEALVTATGMRTEMGRIASLLQATPQEATPLQKELDRVGRILGLLVLAIAAVVVGTIVLLEHVRTASGLFDVLLLGVALAVAAVPEGLPAMVTAVLALGVQRMARRKAIVRHLSAVETLGSADVIASDKTGTLTRNELTVRVVCTVSGRTSFEGTGYAPQGAVLGPDGQVPSGFLLSELRETMDAARSANNASLREAEGRWTIQGDPTEAALLTAARKVEPDAAAVAARYPRVAEVPFSSERRSMSSIHSVDGDPGRFRVFVKGSPDTVLPRCTSELVGGEPRPLSDQRRTELLELDSALAGEALRVLAMARRDVPSDGWDPATADEGLETELVFLGLVGMIDPPRPEAKEAIARARLAGIRPILITGDHPSTAAVIARELGISQDHRVVSGVELEGMSEDDLGRTASETGVYARISPEQKLRLVQALQANGSIVAMTGDGVNDAPALKAADIGVAMGITGTDVSKEAADVVLLDDDYATILVAVEEGRSIYANIRKFLRYLLSSNVGEVLTMFLGVVFARTIGLQDPAAVVVVPLLATQILWVNLVTDGAPALALGLEAPDEGNMSRPPRPSTERIVPPAMAWGIGSVGLVIALGTLGVLDASLPGGLIEGAGDLRHAQTMAFTTLVLFQLFNAFNARSDERSAFHGLFRNRWLWGAVGVSLAAQLAVVHLPFLQAAFSTTDLNAMDWALCLATASSVLWIRELTKFVRKLAAGRAAARST